MKRTSFLPFVVLLLPAMAVNAESPSGISVTGTALVSVPPDRALVTFEVVTRADQPAKARERNAEAARNAMNAVRELGVAEEHIRLDTLRLQPRREYDREQQRHVERGHEALRRIRVDLRDLEQVAPVVVAVLEHGANRLQQVRYDLRDREGAHNDALEAALDNARKKGGLVAGTLGVELGRVRYVEEQYRDHGPGPTLRAEALTTDDEAAAQAPGEIDVQAKVRVVFEINASSNH